MIQFGNRIINLDRVVGVQRVVGGRVVLHLAAGGGPVEDGDRAAVVWKFFLARAGNLDEFRSITDQPDPDEGARPRS